MGTYRMYTDDYEVSRWEEIDLENVPSWTEGIDASQIRFSLRQPGILQDWHPVNGPVPTRQKLISIEVGELLPGEQDKWQDQ